MKILFERLGARVALSALAVTAFASSVQAELITDLGSEELTFIKEFKGSPRGEKTLGLLTSNWTTGFTTGSAGGQSGWTTYGGSAGNYQITASRPGGSAGQGLSITKNSTGNRFFFKDASAAFNARAATEVEVWADFSIYYSSTASTQFARAMGSAMDGSGNNYTAGAGFDLGTATSSGTTYTQGRLRGLAYNTSGTTTGNYSYDLGVTVTGSRWVDFSVVKNLTTGKVTWYWSLDGGANWTGAFINATVRTLSSMEFDYILSGSSQTTTSTASASFGSMALYTVPAPGAAALVGLAGILTARRRQA